MDDWYQAKYTSYTQHARVSQAAEDDEGQEDADGKDQEGEDGGEEGEEVDEVEGVKQKWRGVAPLFGRNLLSVLFTDLVNVFIAPSGVSLLSLMIDSVCFVLFPVVGGMVNMSVLFNYEQDPVTFANSGLEKQSLYVELMKTIKDGFFEIIGRSRFFDQDYSNETLSEPKYEAPKDTNLDEIYVLTEEEAAEDLAIEVEVFDF